MRRCVVNVVAGANTAEEHAITRDNHRNYAAKIGAEYEVIFRDEAPEYGPSAKYLANEVAAKYDQKLLIDVDCVIHPDAPNIFDSVPIGYWGIVNEKGKVAHRGWDAAQQVAFANISEALGQSQTAIKYQPNSGVLVMPQDASRYYFAAPPSITDWCREQLHLGFQLQKQSASVIELDWRWNLCWEHLYFHQKLARAWIVHYAGCPNRKSQLFASLKRFSRAH